MKRFVIRRLAPGAVLLGIWYLLAIWISNPIIAPGPQAVFSAMVLQIQQPSFWSSAGLSLLRSLVSLTVCMISGLLLAFACRKPCWFSSFLDSIVLFVRSLPNIAIIILILFWLPRNACVLVVSFLLVFPIVYTSILAQLRSIDETWRPVFVIYPQPFRIRMRKVYLPLLKNTVESALISASALCFKSTVMAEVLCQVKAGIGRSMQSARFDIDVAGVIGWTFWLLLLVFLMDFILKKGIQWIFRNRRERTDAQSKCAGSCV